ncbi:hypothetical protein PENSPDRAFT_665793 [Peniophora sp. CONT]|nr:hypothetical protein PENSPDRAFT_665793 [Peniophora sp. CONT]
MSEEQPVWDNSLLIPGMRAVDSPLQLQQTIVRDYHKNPTLRLFATIELRLAKCVTHFDDLIGHPRIIPSMRSELDFLRAVLGEVRLTSHVLPPPSDFMRLFQDCVDRNDWTRVESLRALASSVLSQRLSAPILSRSAFPVKEWWLDWSPITEDIPSDWMGFDLADVVIAEGISCVTDAEDITSFENNLNVLANDLGALEKDIMSSTDALQNIENEMAVRLADAAQHVTPPRAASFAEGDEGFVDAEERHVDPLTTPGVEHAPR